MKMRNLKNLTLTVEPAVADWAAEAAARNRTSISRFVGSMLRRAMEGRDTSLSPGPLPAVPGYPLPEHLRTLFWEFVFEDLRWPDDRDLVTAKILEAGEWADMRWLRTRLGEDALRNWILFHGGRGIDVRRLRFLAVVIGLPPHAVQEWVESRRADPWSNRLSS